MSESFLDAIFGAPAVKKSAPLNPALHDLPLDNYFCLNQLKRYLTGHKGYICGGCFKNIFNGEKPKDLDVFFEKQEDFDDAKDLFDKRCESEEEGPTTYRLWYETDNVVAYKNLSTDVVVELCRKTFGTPQEVLSRFDFTVVKAAMYKTTTEDDEGEDRIEYRVLLHKDFFEHLHMRRLVVDNDVIYFPVATFERVLRYARYGYAPCRETKMKVLDAIHRAPPEELAVPRSLYNGMD